MCTYKVLKYACGHSYEMRLHACIASMLSSSSHTTTTNTSSFSEHNDTEVETCPIHTARVKKVARACGQRCGERGGVDEPEHQERGGCRAWVFG